MKFYNDRKAREIAGLFDVHVEVLEELYELFRKQLVFDLCDPGFHREFLGQEEK